MDLPFLADEVRACVAPILDGSRRAAAAFDADGTLWPGDVGDAFLEWLDSERRVPSLPRGGAWPVYEAMLREDVAAAYRYATEVMEGLAESDVRAWAEPLVRERFVRRMYPPMRALVDALREAGHDIWIVSASNAWVVRAAAEMLGLCPGRVVACETEVEAGRLTARLKTPLPLGAGKADCLRARGVAPALAAGNSRFDGDMLRLAERAFVVAERDAPNRAAIAMAREAGWPVLWVEGEKG